MLETSRALFFGDNGPLIEEKGEEPVGDSLLGEVYDGMSRELVVHYVDGVKARRPAELREEELDIGRAAKRIARNANRWSMVATCISLIAFAVALLAYARL